ncbi:hypothetical protein [Neomicrococcus aestuarii]|uniref:hypothetical protein n=1 Tax=Neomicrococcus aestuarii TaxID=556325 RepID=UPI003AAFC839
MGVIGSGIYASKLSTTDDGLALLENSIATGAILVALIIAFQGISASFNPVVTLVNRFLGHLDTKLMFALMGAQMAGASPARCSPTSCLKSQRSPFPRMIASAGIFGFPKSLRR